MNKHGDYVEVTARTFPSVSSAYLFKMFCEGIDQARNEERKYEYQVAITPKKKLDSKTTVTILEF